ncbi:histone-lysine N-methyltransferase SETMAR [Trichonephila clavipes]|nr:histone-lysine N-methyltransferase SETMAR [Trichonephila clavipes]
MEVNKKKIRYILQFFFDKGENAIQGAEIVNGVYGADTVTANYVQFWFRRFRSGIFDVKYALRTVKPVVENAAKFTEIIQVDRQVSSPSISQELKINHKAVLNHLRKRGEAAQTVAKPGLTAKKVLLYIWWDWKGIIYYELLPYGQTLNLDLYCQQLDHLKLAIDQKRPELVNRRGVVFRQNKARPHTSVVTRQKLWMLGWEVLMHSPYSPDLAPSDYRLFLAMQNFLSDKKLGSIEDCENLLLESFTNKDQDFYDKRHYEANFKMTINYTTKQCIFDPNRTIRNMLNKVLNFMQKLWISFYPT